MSALARRVLAVGVVVAGVVTLVALLRMGADHERDAFGSVTTGVVTLGTGAALLLAAWRRHHGRGTWTVLGVGMVALALGQAVQAVDQAIRGSVAGIAPSDPFYALGCLGLVGAFTLAPGHPEGRRRVQVALDGLVVGLAGFLVVWTITGQPLVRATHLSFLDTAVVAFYPTVVSSAFCTAVVSATLFDHRFRRCVVVLVVGGMGLLTCASVAFAVAELRSLPANGGSLLIGVVVLGFAMVAAGALASDEPVAAGRPRLERHSAVVVPLFALLLGVVAVATAGAQGRVDAAHVLVGGLLLAVLAARNTLTMLAHNHLIAHLNTSVAEGVEELERERARFRALAQYSTDLVAVVDRRDRVTWASPSLQRLLAREGATDLFDVLHPDDVDVVRQMVRLARARPTGGALSGEARLQHRDGDVCHLELIANDLTREAAVGGVVLSGRDVTERRRLTDDLRWRADHDNLTGLANRDLFRARLEEALAARRGPAPTRAVFVDLDGFKTINDTLGHSVGDELLEIVARRISNAVRESDLVARLGGDEFAVLLPATTDEQADRVAGRLVAALREPYRLDGVEVLVHASVGMSTAEPGLTADDLLARADLAMYAAKGRGGDRWLHFDASMGADAGLRLDLAVRLRQAIEDGQISVVFQPVVDLASGDDVSVEALARWVDPEHGPISPGVFVPLAEELGLVARLGRLVVDRALADLRTWIDVAPDDAPAVAVNVSSRELSEPGFADSVLDAVARHGVAPSRLVVELTERLFVDTSGPAMDNLVRLRSAGVRVAVDDFGTGYSSLAQLHELPVDVLKIDRAFIAQLEAAPRPQDSIAGVVVALARTLGLRVVAEGVETSRQAELLRTLGCDMAQGWHFERARPLAYLLERRRAAAA